MTVSSKWIRIESHTESVTRVARRALKERLRWVWSRLPLAALAANEDIEHVHQLRVATRRAHAAMETFARYLPPRRAAWFDRRLKRIRRAAGEARDLDVLTLRVRAALTHDPCDAGKAILRRIDFERQKAQPAIVEVYDHLQTRRFAERLKKLVHGIRLRPASSEQGDGKPCAGGVCDCDGGQAACDGSCCAESAGQAAPTIAEAARAAMRELVNAWFAAAAADLSDTGRLHRFRIAGKRLRYGMEIFASALGSNCRKSLYPQVVEILEQLGQINDHVTSEARLQDWLNEIDEPQQRVLLTRLLSADVEAITAGLHAFFQLWTPDRRQSLQAQFEDELSSP